MRLSATILVVASTLHAHAQPVLDETPVADTELGDPELDAEVIEISGTAPKGDEPLEYKLSASDITSTPGAMNDALRAVTTLPAAARIPFSFGGLVLRGMSPRDSRVFIDGVEIPIAFHFGGLVSVLPTQGLDGASLIPSGYDVSRGRAQGGVVELTSRRPRGDRIRLGGETSLLHAMVSAEGPLPAQGAFILTLRRSYLDVVLRPFVGATDPLPSYTDGQFRAVWGEPKRSGQLALYAIGSLDQIANSPDAATPSDPSNGGHSAANLGFIRVGASYKRQIGRHLWTIAPVIGANVLGIYDKSYHEGASKPDVLDLDRRLYLFGGRSDWVHNTAHGSIRVGADLRGGYLGRVSQYQDGQSDIDIPLPRNTVSWTDAAAYVELRRSWLSDKLVVLPGIRIDRFGLGEEWTTDPRINAHATLTPSATLRASVGRFHQPPSPAHFDEFADNLGAKSSYVDQATLGIEIAPERGMELALAGFGHEGRRTLVEIQQKSIRPTGIDLDRVFAELLEEQLGLYPYQANVGRQRSYGLESTLRMARASYRVQANFTWSRALRKYEPGTTDPWVRYSLDQPCRLNLLAATTARNWNFGTRLTVASGNPVNVVPQGTMMIAGMEPKRIAQRLPTFWQLDVRIERIWKRTNASVRLFFDLQNISNHRNIEFRESISGSDARYRNHDTLGLPFIPYLGIELAPH